MSFLAETLICHPLIESICSSYFKQVVIKAFQYQGIANPEVRYPAASAVRFQPRLSMQESTIYCYMKNGRHLHGGQVAILIIINLAIFAITFYFTLGTINDVAGSVVLAIITLLFFCMTFLDIIFSWILSHCYSNQVVVQYRFTSMKNNLNVKKKSVLIVRVMHSFIGKVDHFCLVANYPVKIQLLV